MHETSLLKMRAFRDVYCAPPARVLDVGAQAFHVHDTYRPLFEGFDYVGLDLEMGPNVDVVPSDPFVWAELQDGSFDVVISGQAFEHNPFPWVTMAEVTRVLRPGGLFCLIAPSAGAVHRFPLDCWRFYPDAATALCGYVGLELVESYVENDHRRLVKGAEWRDFFMVARRPADVDLPHLRRILETRRPVPAAPAGAGGGPAAAAYESAVEVSDREWRKHRVDAFLRRVLGPAIQAFRSIRRRMRARRSGDGLPSD